MIEVVVERPETLLVEIKKSREKYEEMIGVVDEMKKAEVRNLRGDKQEIKRALKLKKEKMYVLKDKKLRLEVIQLYYDVPVTGCKGR